MFEVKIAEDLWDTPIEGAITTWYVEDGDRVAQGDLLADVMVEKAQFEIEAPVAGRVQRRVGIDGVVTAGDVVAVIVPE